MTTQKKYCLIKNCEHFFGTLENVRMFRFPKDNNIANKWKSVLQISKDNSQNVCGSVCIKHFSDDDFIKEENGSITLKKNAVTILNLLQQETENHGGDTKNIVDCDNCIRIKENYVDELQKHQNRVTFFRSKSWRFAKKIKKVTKARAFCGKIQIEIKWDNSKSENKQQKCSRNN